MSQGHLRADGECEQREASDEEGSVPYDGTGGSSSIGWRFRTLRGVPSAPMDALERTALEGPSRDARQRDDTPELT
jgi:hypothetical protein